MRSVVARIFMTSQHRLRVGWLLPLPVAGVIASIAPAAVVAFLVAQVKHQIPRQLVPPVGIAIYALVPVTALALTFVLRRFLDRRPWSGLGLTGARTAPLHFIAGFVGGLTLILVADAIAVGLDLASWTSWTELAPRLPGIAASILPILFSQAFPEELWFRGYQLRNLGATLPLWLATILSTVSFGVIHFVSRSDASTTLEQTLYVLQATGLGFALAACRIATGKLWVCIGMHAGNNTIHGELITAHPGRYGMQLVVLAGTLAVAGLIVLAWRHWRAPLSWRLPWGDDPVTGSTTRSPDHDEAADPPRQPTVEAPQPS